MISSSDRQTGSWRDTLLVYRREIEARMFTKSYLFGLLFGAVIVVGMVVVFSPSSSPKTYTVAVCGAQRSSFGPAPQGIRLQPCSNAAAARARIEGKHLDAAVAVQDGRVSVLMRADTASQAQDAATSMGRHWATAVALSQQHVDTARLDRSIAEDAPRIVTVGDAKPQGSQGVGAAISMVIVLFSQIMGQGSMVAQGVVEEKSTRIVEVLLSTLTPIRLMIGKVAGIGTAAIVQIAAMAAALVAARYAEHGHTMTLPGTAALISGVGWFLLSFVLFAFLFAAAGSLVSRPEELQSVLAPIMMFLMAPMAVAVAAANSPTSSWVDIVRYIPPFSGMLMPLQASIGAVSVEQQLTAAAVMLLTTAGCAWLGARVYRNSVLKIGARVGWRQALAA